MADSRRREHLRRSVQGVDLRCYRSGSSPQPHPREVLRGEILDLSPGGARLRLDQSLSPGEVLMIELRDRRSGESIRARGEVRWSRPDPAGPETRFSVGLQLRDIYAPVGRIETFGLSPAIHPPIATERRGDRRFPVRDYVVVLVPRGSLSPLGFRKNLAREVLDLGRQGVRLRVVEPLPTGAGYRFTLHFPALAEALQVSAEVRWCRPDPRSPDAAFQAGLRFLNLSEEERKRIDRLEHWLRRSSEEVQP